MNAEDTALALALAMIEGTICGRATWAHMVDHLGLPEMPENAILAEYDGKGVNFYSRCE